MPVTLYQEMNSPLMRKIKEDDMFLVCKNIGGNFIVMETQPDSVKAHNALKLLRRKDQIAGRKAPDTDYRFFKRGLNPIKQIS